MNTSQASSEKTKLEKKFAFWYRIFDDSLLGVKALNKNEYENQVKKIAEFETVIHFVKSFRLRTSGASSNTFVSLILLSLE